MLLAAFLLSIAGDAGKGVPQDTSHAVSPDEMAARMEACGFEKVEISYQDYVQSDVVQIGDRAIADERMRCLIENTRKTAYLVEVGPGSRARYYELLEELWRPEQLARITGWLADRPELGPPPERLEGETMTYSLSGSKISAAMMPMERFRASSASSLCREIG